jgi:DNA-binding response OmpR family regulator
MEAAMAIPDVSSVYGDVVARPPVARRRVFLAEDDDTLRTLVASTLRAAGYHVMEARDGLELLAGLEFALVSEHERPEHLILVSDIEMPGLTGLDVLTIVRCAHLDTACILITAFGDRETVSEASDLGARVFQKPFDIDDLVSALVELAPPS